ncbi:MAG: hypothetical protein Phog2KO_13550 [Phototrophicaceae bacterium]
MYCVRHEKHKNFFGRVLKLYLFYVEVKFLSLRIKTTQLDKDMPTKGAKEWVRAPLVRFSRQKIAKCFSFWEIMRSIATVYDFS